MLSGVKFIPRDQLNNGQDDDEDAASLQKRKKQGSGSGSKRKRDKHKRKKKTSSRYDSSDGIGSSGSDDDLERVKKGSRRNKKWYSSDEPSSEDYTGSESEDSYDQCSSKRESRGKKNKKNGGKNRPLAEFSSEDKGQKGSAKDGRNKGKKKVGDDFSDDGQKSHSTKDMEIARKEIGLDWMLRSSDKIDKKPAVSVDVQPEQTPDDEVEGVNPKELNPYLKGNGSGYPDDVDENRAGEERLPSSALVGDGGASWRLKALKRAREQAAREGRKLEDVVEERWGSLGQLAVSVASGKAASSRAHLHAINNRRRAPCVESQKLTDNQNGIDMEQGTDQGYLKGVSVRHPDMKAPKVHDSLSWGKRKSQKMSTEDASVISAAASSLNKFANDGSFMNKVLGQQNEDFSGSVGFDTNQGRKMELNMDSYDIGQPSDDSVVKEVLSANQLAAKALQLRLKGKLQEADKLMQEAENMKARQGDENSQYSSRHRRVGSMARHVKDISARRKEEDADRHLAQKIIQNKQYSLSGRADDEYDFEDAPGRKSKKKRGGDDHNVPEKTSLAKRILTRQERCLFCFENPNRPKHLVVSIANFSYLMLPQWQSVVPGHCCILTMQHESATRTVDNNVWEEIRNFKKCLIMMFAKQEMELIFLETVMGLAQQRRHCLIECVPLPQKIAKQAPLYFKKAIDEAEDEWSQHNAKKLIDTSEKGLRGSIPKDFPYFHVEFGLNSGFVHVIDDEKQFKSSLGLNVIRGMLRLPEEDMYRRRQHESVEVQRQAVASFAQDWEPFDWTKQLD